MVTWASKYLLEKWWISSWWRVGLENFSGPSTQDGVEGDNMMEISGIDG